MTDKRAGYRELILFLVLILLLTLSACRGVSLDPVQQDDPVVESEQDKMAHQDLPGANLAGAAGSDSETNSEAIAIESANVDYVPSTDVEDIQQTFPTNLVLGTIFGLVLVAGFLVWLVKYRSKSSD